MTCGKQLICQNKLNQEFSVEVIYTVLKHGRQVKFIILDECFYTVYLMGFTG